jgi:hypothetical protein
MKISASVEKGADLFYSLNGGADRARPTAEKGFAEFKKTVGLR